MENVLKYVVIRNDKKKAYDVRDDLIKEQRGIKYVEEKDYAWISFESYTYLIPLTGKGFEILEITYNWINDFLDNENKIIEELYELVDDQVISKTSIDNFKEILNTYDELDIKWLKKEDILVLKNIENYKFKTRLEIASLSSIEILIRLLNQNISIADIKKIKENDHFIPIIFPIKFSPKTNFRYIQDRRWKMERENRRYSQTIQNNFYKGDINLAELLELGYLKLNINEEV